MITFLSGPGFSSINLSLGTDKTIEGYHFLQPQSVRTKIGFALPLASPKIIALPTLPCLHIRLNRYHWDNRNSAERRWGNSHSNYPNFSVTSSNKALTIL